ncbi:hypothetical protein ACFV9C_44020 [Kribbella sp. NPDC059898]|uniref:hypothetical protein n=1 Tax=Kribbella sp. NPDC059898 TaxID=3346995 RepID=UPI003651C8E4
MSDSSNETRKPPPTDELGRSKGPWLSVQAWRIVATALTMGVAGLSAIWVLYGAPDRYSDMPTWFRNVAVINLALLIFWVVVGTRLKRSP